MPLSLILTEKAEEDLDDAYYWYEERESGLGKEVIRCIDTKIANINRHPLQHSVVQNKYVRRALVDKFPFSIYFEIEEELITIFAILHQRRSPDYWKSRI